MTFAERIPLLLKLKKLKRESEHKNIYMMALGPDDNMTLTCFEFTKNGKFMDYNPYALTAEDLTATDWEVAE